MRTHEMASLERMSLGWGWHDAKNAAALACELIRWATPPVRWVNADAPEISELEARLGCEQPVGGDPYRVLGDQRVCADPQEVTDARFYIALALSYVSTLADGKIPDPPADVGQPEEHPLTRLYWYASYLGSKTVENCNQAANATYQYAVSTTVDSVTGRKKFHVPEGINEAKQRWYAVGNAVKAATEFIRKFASQNPVIGAIDGAAGGILHRISMELAHAGKPTEEITGQMFHWRVKDALKGKELPPELAKNLRPAFEAAWSAGEYTFAYSLLDDLDAIAETP
jgi:hypothetical protein